MESKSASIYTRLLDAIMSGELQPGERLSEVTLSARYGASRTPVRQALSQLEYEGLVSREGLLAAVRERDSEEIIDLYSCRIMIERAIADSACERRRTLDILRLRDLIAAAEALAPDDIPGRTRCNREFHEVLAAAAHNIPLVDLQKRITRQIDAIPGTTLADDDRWATAHAQHIALVDAIEARDSAAAGDLAAQHMEGARDLRLAMMRRDARA